MIANHTTAAHPANNTFPLEFTRRWLRRRFWLHRRGKRVVMTKGRDHRRNVYFRTNHVCQLANSRAIPCRLCPLAYPPDTPEELRDCPHKIWARVNNSEGTLETEDYCIWPWAMPRDNGRRAKPPEPDMRQGVLF